MYAENFIYLLCINQRLNENTFFLKCTFKTPGTLRWKFNTLTTLPESTFPSISVAPRNFVTGLISNSGKLKFPVVVPVVKNFMIDTATSYPMLVCASSVEPPICGVKIVFGQFWRTVWKFGPLLNGSTGYTSCV